MDDAGQAGQAGAKGDPAGALTPIIEGGTPSVAAPSLALAPTPAGQAIASMPAMSAPLEIRLAANASGVSGAGVDVTPATITLAPDPAGPLGQNTLTLANGSNAEQMVWLSYEAPDLLSVTVEQPIPSGASVVVAVDLADAASRGSSVATLARLYVTTPSGTTVVTVSWRPLPYGRM